MGAQHQVGAQVADNVAVVYFLEDPALVPSTIHMVLDYGDAGLVGSLGHIDY